MKNVLNKLTNTHTLIALVSLTMLIFTTWGIQIPQKEIEATVQILCSMGVLLGIMNDKSMQTNVWDDKGNEWSNGSGE